MLKTNRSISRSIFATIDRESRRTCHWNGERHCVFPLFAFYFFFLARRCLLFRKISLSYVLKDASRISISETCLYNARDVFIMHKFTFLSSVKCVYGPRECLSCGRGMILFNRTLLHPPMHPAHRTGMSLLALSSIFVAPYRSSLTPFEVVTPRRWPCWISFADGRN